MGFGPTKEQQRVLDSKEQQVLLSAGPGTGKTDLLAFSSILDGKSLARTGRRSTKVVVFSHTNAAKDKIEQRIGELPGGRPVRRRIWCTTFHAFSLAMLNKYGGHPYWIRDGINKSLLEKAIRRKGLVKKLPRKLRSHLLRAHTIRMRTGKPLDLIIKETCQKLEERRREAKLALDELEREKTITGRLEIDECIYFFNLLLNDRRIRNQVQKSFPLVLVDEFQDTLDIQWKMLGRLIGRGVKILAAGDPGQAIFQWAGASLRRFDQFRDRFPGCGEYNLTINHRSTVEIVSFCQQLLSQSSLFSYPKGVSKTKDCLPVVVCCGEKNVLCEHIVTEVKCLVEKGESLDDMAIPYRFHSDRIRMMAFLEKEGIPHCVYEDRVRRVRPFVALISAFIKIMEEPVHGSQRRSNSWEKVFLSLKGVGTKNAQRIIEWLGRRNNSTTTFPRKLRFSDSLEELLKFVGEIRSLKGISTVDKLERIIEFADRHLKVNRSHIQKDIATLFYLAERTESLRDLIPKYKDPSYPTIYPITSSRPPFSWSYLTLSTVHRIKGKEFRNVFFLGTEDEKFERHQMLKGKAKQEEELLLMNVAASRAGNRLFFFIPIDQKSWNDQTKLKNPWIFIKRVTGRYYRMKWL
jgi:DNA helicase-2/ATP-dependent DNA helicase PcrA